MLDLVKSLTRRLVRFVAVCVAIGVGGFLLACVAAAAQRLWGNWDAMFWQYAFIVTSVGVLAATVLRSRSRRGPRPSTRSRSRSRAYEYH